MTVPASTDILRELADRNHELNARADLLIAQRDRLEMIARVADSMGYDAIAEAIRDAIKGPPEHPDDLGGVSDDGHPTGQPLEVCPCNDLGTPPPCFRCKYCGRTGAP